MATFAFTRWDGERDKAVIRTRRTTLGYTASIKIGPCSRTVTAPHSDPETATGVALRVLLNHREHSVI